MNFKRVFVSSLALCALVGPTLATVVPEGTDVRLVFREGLSSRTAKPGDTVRLEVDRDVMVHNKVVLAAGTKVRGTIESVGKSGAFGKNGSIRLTINPVNGIPLEPRTKGKTFKGSRTDHAAEVSGGGLLLLGPVGLVGGIFVKGKSVVIHPGDHLETDVSRTVDIH